MATRLFELMTAHRDELADALYQRLKASRAPHYRGADEPRLRERSGSLVAALVLAADGDPSPFIDYVRGMTEERISEGYFLDEIQLVFSLLEEKSWELVQQHTPLEDQVRQLARVSATIGGAKDAIARLYLERERSCEARVAQLESEIGLLFQGTEAPTELSEEKT